MGEIKIKSGNLYPIAIGEDTWNNLNDATHSNNNGELIVVMGTVDNSSVYSPSGSIIRTVHKDLSTYSWSVEIKADSPASLVIGFEGDGVKYFNITSEYQKLTFNNQSFISDKAFVMYNRTGVTRTVYLRNFMLNEGSTALPYQPYFLNRPAHQVTNGQFVDIPTHHYTNGRWQGELTSQSPLKFWADGEMLDWRVEGRTSGNLFDIGKNVNDYERAYQIISVDGSLISMKLEGSGMTFHYRTHNITTTGTVTIYCKGSKTKPKLFVRLRSMDNTKWLTNSDVTISGMTYNSVYNGWSSYAMGDTFIKTIIIPKCLYWNMGVGFNGEDGTMGEIVTISNPMVISGTYTASTLPPYEPYGGVGDWDETAQRYKIPVTVNGITTNLYTDHQLMEGDSIDYAITETQIPIATGNNILTVDTAVQPSKVFVKFEG